MQKAWLCCADYLLTLDNTFKLSFTTVVVVGFISVVHYFSLLHLEITCNLSYFCFRNVFFVCVFCTIILSEYLPKISTQYHQGPTMQNKIFGHFEIK